MYLGPRRSSSGTLIRGCLADTQLNAHIVMARYLGTTGPRGPRNGKETRMLTSHASSPLRLLRLSGAKLSWSTVVRTSNTGKGPGWNHLCRWTARGPGLRRTPGWGGGGTHLRNDAKPNGWHDRLFHGSGWVWAHHCSRIRPVADSRGWSFWHFFFGGKMRRRPASVEAALLARSARFKRLFMGLHPVAGERQPMQNPDHMLAPHRLVFEPKMNGREADEPHDWSILFGKDMPIGTTYRLGTRSWTPRISLDLQMAGGATWALMGPCFSLIAGEGVRGRGGRGKKY